MWLREPIDIELTRNSQTPIGLQFWDEAENAPLSIDGYSFSCNVGKTEGSGVLASFTCTLVDASLGALDINFDGTVLSGQPGAQDITTFAYQVLATSAGVTVTAMRGALILTPGVR